MVRTVVGVIIIYDSYFFYLLSDYVVMWCVVLLYSTGNRQAGCKQRGGYSWLKGALQEQRMTGLRRIDRRQAAMIQKEKKSKRQLF